MDADYLEEAICIVCGKCQNGYKCATHSRRLRGETVPLSEYPDKCQGLITQMYKETYIWWEGSAQEGGMKESVIKSSGRRIPVYAAVGIAVFLITWTLIVGALLLSTFGAMGMPVDPDFTKTVIFGAGAGMVICVILAIVGLRDDLISSWRSR